MRCDQLKELLPLHLLDLLGPQEEEAVREHLEGSCPRCAAEVAASREALDLLPFALSAEEPSPMARERLIAAAKGTRETAPPARSLSWLRAAAASAAAALLAAFLAGSIVARRYGSEVADLRGRMERQDEELASLRQKVREAEESILLVSSPAVTVIDLAGQEPQAQASGRIFWDRARDRWQLYAAKLPPAGAGKTYQLWLITPTAKLSAGIFDPAERGEASGSVSVPPEAGPVLAAAVTDEPQGGSPQPTGSILLLGKLPA